MSNTKKLLAYHLSRLQDRSAEIRRRTIEELRKLGDPDALPALEAVYKTDPDAGVRQAAQEAGRALWIKQQQSKSP